MNLQLNRQVLTHKRCRWSQATLMGTGSSEEFYTLSGPLMNNQFKTKIFNSSPFKFKKLVVYASTQTLDLEMHVWYIILSIGLQVCMYRGYIE